jgi:hypothetical protein
VIYEGFADSDASLGGNTAGTGLTGAWSGSGSNPSIIANQTYGSLATSGNAARAVSGWTNNQVSIDPANTGYTSLLANGGEMCFSMIYQADITSNISRFAFGIGDAGFTSNGNLSSGQAIGFANTSNGRIYAGLWSTTSWGNNLQNAPTNDDGTGYGSYTVDTNMFIVGRVQWGATDLDDDNVTLYMPGTDLVLGSAVASSSGQVSQDSFNLLATHNGNTITSTFDEILLVQPMPMFLQYPSHLQQPYSALVV